MAFGAHAENTQKYERKLYRFVCIDVKMHFHLLFGGGLGRHS